MMFQREKSKTKIITDVFDPYIFIFATTRSTLSIRSCRRWEKFCMVFPFCNCAIVIKINISGGTLSMAMAWEIL